MMLCLMVLAAVCAPANAALQSDAANENSTDKLDALKARVAAGQLEEEQQKAAGASIAIVESNIARVTANNEKTADNLAKAKSAESLTEKLRSDPPQLAAASTEKQTVADLEQAKRMAIEDLAKAKTELKQVQESIAQRSAKLTQNSDLILQLQEQQKQQQTKAAAPAGKDAHPLVVDAMKLEIASTLESIESEIRTLQSQQELFAAEQKSGFLLASNEYWSTAVKQRQERADLISARLEQQRQQETKESADQAKAVLAKVPEPLKEFAEENARLAELSTSLLDPLQRARRELKGESLRLDQLEKKYRATRTRVETVGLTSSVGAYLRNRKSEVPHDGWMQTTLLDRLHDIEKYQSSLFDLEESQQSLLTDEVIETALANLPSEADQASRDEVKEAATKLVFRRRELLNQAISSHKDLLDSLEKLKKTETSLATISTSFNEYINERILWIRSNTTLFTEIQKDDSDAELVSSTQWITLGKDFLADLFRVPFLYISAAVGLAFLLMRRNGFLATVVQKAGIVLKGTNTNFLPTLETLLLAAIMALPVPLVLVLVGWRLSSMPTKSSLAEACGKALIATAFFYFVAEFISQIIRSKGLGESHFRWATSTLVKLRRELRWFVPIAAVFVFLCTLIYSVDPIHQTDTIERVAFIAALGLLAAFVYRTFHPATGVFREQFAANPRSWLTQTSKFWFWALVGVPAALIVMIVVGYYYSAIQMLTRLYWTLILVLGLGLVKSLIMRFVSLSRRKARIAQARARSLAQNENTENKSTQATELERVFDQEAFIASENESLDENVVRSQKLVAAVIAVACTISMFMIWSDVVPAIKGLDRYVFWTTTVERVAEIPIAANETPAIASPQTALTGALTPSNQTAAVISDNGTIKELKQVTLRNLLLAIVVLALSIFAVRNLPAFIELVFLKHLPIEQSVRHAIKAITGYVILMLGIVIAGRMMYIGWSQIQWLATALTFGLAFGLQEIFANFIAGIILLLERPIRIGDIVEVGEVKGTVTRIRIRATTIRNFDQKEFVVPNKEFITGRLLNWTLSDKVIRQTIRVGVAYGSDVRKAKEIIRGICESHPAVLADPKPVITFEEFADSSLNISARIHLKDFDSWWTTMDEINLQIDDAFKEANIEISFPQRDLHIRSAPAELLDSMKPQQEREDYERTI